MTEHLIDDGQTHGMCATDHSRQRGVGIVTLSVYLSTHALPRAPSARHELISIGFDADCATLRPLLGPICSSLLFTELRAKGAQMPLFQRTVSRSTPIMPLGLVRGYAVTNRGGLNQSRGRRDMINSIRTTDCKLTR